MTKHLASHIFVQEPLCRFPIEFYLGIWECQEEQLVFGVDIILHIFVFPLLSNR